MDNEPASPSANARNKLSPATSVSPVTNASGHTEGNADIYNDNESTESADSGGHVVVEDDDSLDSAPSTQRWNSEQRQLSQDPQSQTTSSFTRQRTSNGKVKQRSVHNLNLVRSDLLELGKTTCSVCGELLPTVSELETHMLSHGLYLCTTCLRCFKYKRSFENHTFICKDLHCNQQVEPSFADSLNDKVFSLSEKLTSEDAEDNKPSDFNKYRRRSQPIPEPGTVFRRRKSRGSSIGQLKLTRPSLIPVSSAANESDGSSQVPDLKEQQIEASSSDCDLQTLALAAAAMTPHTLADTDYRAQRQKLPIETETSEQKTESPPPVLHLPPPPPPVPPPHANFHIPFPAQVFMSTAVLNNSDVETKQPPLVWQGIQIQTEKPLISQLEGFNPVTEQRYLLYRCCLCGHSYPSVSLLAFHLTAHCRNSKEPACDKCGAIFKWRSQLEVHDQVHQVLETSIQSSPTGSSLPSGYMMVHSAISQQQQQQQRDKPGISQSADKLQCQGHSPILHQHLLSPGPYNASLPTNGEDPKMGLLTESGNFLKPPQRGRRRFESRFTNFNCKYCPKTFDRLFSLQRHERVHTGVKPCFCKQCGRGFSERRNLRHHIIRFHSDNSQREAFRRQRRNKARGQNSSLKLVSFLKKTAVRILNSMEQSRVDCEPDPPNLIYQEKENSVSLDQAPKTDEPMEEDMKVTVVMPSDEKLCESVLGQLESTDRKEVLLDPKRSLIGSRRKGRPFKYSSASQFTNGNEQSEEILMPDVRNNSILVKVEVDSDDANSNAYSEMLQVSLPVDGTIPPEALPNFKARLRGHGSFFSSYNPRLGVVNKPIPRMEACRPQLGEDGKCVYPCSYCFKTFCSTSDLNRHMDFHEDVRPFKCPYCNYHSRTNSQLKVHMMRHQGIKQYLCTTCNYNGVTQSDLNRHMKTRTHILRTRNICVGCGLGFYTRSLLEEHQRMFNHSIATAAVAAAAVATGCDFKALAFSRFSLMAADKSGCTVPVPDIPAESQSVSV